MNNSLNFRFSTDEFIEKSIEIYGDKFTYENVEYINAKTKIIITCVLHGDFTIDPNHHLRKNTIFSGGGCKKCSSKLRKDIQRTPIDVF